MFAPLGRRAFVLALLGAPLAGGCACARRDHLSERVRERDAREWELRAAAAQAAPPVNDPTASDREVWEERSRREAEFRAGGRR
ncbi:hypothetical protein GobsT_05080 [Gemmata obscuriglobus]|uniref:Lipoprotein n=1 Tax=Gemmata obscuriglobus TaxID=114 RepID=A0A2Z3H918_9BACT|nr:hypothetical protein [Gemmata obscuriglobus]AWM40922.1 hypothetical protein C1280_30650 [Gemmata obscuriglobus]QEG25773.1 hypothetical protein GobsT_05080 [Gemmata obscuriglobus]VTR99598.1 unnamed protein product [Gemmata obscuriglobus UQM 2246]